MVKAGKVLAHHIISSMHLDLLQKWRLVGSIIDRQVLLKNWEKHLTRAEKQQDIQKMQNSKAPEPDGLQFHLFYSMNLMIS